MIARIVKLERRKQQILDELLSESRAMETLVKEQQARLKDYRSFLKTSMEKVASDDIGNLEKNPRKTALVEQETDVWQPLRNSVQESQKLFLLISTYQDLLESVDKKIQQAIWKQRTKRSLLSVITRYFKS